MLTAERLKEALHYEPETGEWTRLQGQKFSNHGRTGGSVNGDGYRTIRVDGVIYKSSRLSWLYMTGEWPHEEVDHIDLDRANDRWKNLRSATHGQNVANRGKQNNNFGEFKGAYLDKRSGRWGSTIKKGGKFKWLGTFSTPEEAHAAYCAAARDLHGEFARAE